MRVLVPTVAAAVLLAAGCPQYRNVQAADDKTPMSASKTQPTEEARMEKAMFGAGCFWGVEYIFRGIEGVKDVACGYSGGKTPNPTYQEVCSDVTGHAEVIEVDYDPNIVTYDQLLDIFWRCHDPTQMNRQGPDIGSQYRSVIFYRTPEQEKIAKASKEKWDRSGKFDKPIVTTIEKAGPFYRAEAYHQQYYARKGGQPYCHYLRPE